MYKKLRVTQPTEEWQEHLGQYITKEFCEDFEKAVSTRLRIIGCSETAVRITAETLEGCWDACDDWYGPDAFSENMLYWMTATRDEIEDFFGETYSLNEQEQEDLESRRLTEKRNAWLYQIMVSKKFSVDALQEYFEEAEHQDGLEYWDNFKEVEELIADIQIAVDSAD